MGGGGEVLVTFGNNGETEEKNVIHTGVIIFLIAATIVQRCFTTINFWYA